MLAQLSQADVTFVAKAILGGVLIVGLLSLVLPRFFDAVDREADRRATDAFLAFYEEDEK